MTLRTYYITGASSGLGLAIAQHLLPQPNTVVVGMSRRQTLEQDNYKHVFLDLADAQAVANFAFNIKSPEATLVNNAGTLGQVAPLGKLDAAQIERPFQINLIAPTVLTNAFIRDSENVKKRAILNISSGAAQNPISGWSTYCSAKAGLNMLTEVGSVEQPNIQFLALAPGIVDTPMQAQIRATLASDFEDLPRFIDYHNHGSLTDPQVAAQQIVAILNGAFKIGKKVFSLRELDINK